MRISKQEMRLVVSDAVITSFLDVKVWGKPIDQIEWGGRFKEFYSLIEGMFDYQDNNEANETEEVNKSKLLVEADELTKIDHWKQQGRGDPVKAFGMREKKI
jgi:hypothetical protein